MITFAIPTWNRAEKLKRCVESIVVQSPAQVVICDDASNDETQKVCAALAKKYPCVKYLRFEDRQNFAGNYKRAVLAAEQEYVWTFGDDDLLMEGALSFMVNNIKNTQFDFYHASESIRTAKAEAMCGTVLEICNAIGWLDFTGFISCNIGRTSLMQAGVSSAQWPVYAKSSFPQSLAILEIMAGRSAMMMEIGVVESSKLGDDDTAKRWAENSICWNYLYVADGLKHLVEVGTVPPKVPETFFRYITESLFNRLMRDFNGREVLDPGAVTAADWACLHYLADMVSEERGNKLATWVRAVHAKIQEESHNFKASVDAYARLTVVMNTIEMPTFSHSYLP